VLNDCGTALSGRPSPCGEGGYAFGTEDAQVVYDARRDRWLEAEGYRVMCVATAEVYVNVDGVLDTIWAALGEQMSARGRDTPT
jgi:hypothetical protein